jgi:hypothetical protein
VRFPGNRPSRDSAWTRSGQDSSGFWIRKSRPKLDLALNPNYKLGMFFISPRAGIASLNPGIEAFFIAPGDQPEIRREEYDKHH